MLMGRNFRMVVVDHGVKPPSTKLGWKMVCLKQKNIGFGWVWEGSSSRRTGICTTKPDVLQQNEEEMLLYSLTFKELQVSRKF